MLFLLSMEGSLVNKRDLLALYLSGTHCYKTRTRPLSCATPRQPTMFTTLPVFTLNWLDLTVQLNPIIGCDFFIRKESCKKFSKMLTKVWFVTKSLEQSQNQKSLFIYKIPLCLDLFLQAAPQEPPDLEWLFNPPTKLAIRKE